MIPQKEVAANYLQTGRAKVALPYIKMLVMGIMAGLFIGFAAAGANTVSATVESASVVRLLAACVFPCGLIMVVIAGSELFTGNCLLVIPWLSREIRLTEMLANWLWVYIGNFIGALLVVLICCWGGQLSLFGGGLAVTTIEVAAAKAGLDFGAAFCLGVGCNFLVCIAVWMSFSSRPVAGKILAIFMPVMLFVLCGFEHSVADMYYVPAGIWAAGIPEYASQAAAAGVELSGLTWGNFLLNNLLPVTLGNIIGGSLLVGAGYWFVYLRGSKKN